MSEIKTEVISDLCSLPSSVSQDVVAVNEEKKVPAKKEKEEDLRRKKYRSTLRDLKEVDLLVKQQGLKN
jgi:hypothetical protein